MERPRSIEAPSRKAISKIGTPSCGSLSRLRERGGVRVCSFSRKREKEPTCLLLSEEADDGRPVLFHRKAAERHGRAGVGGCRRLQEHLERLGVPHLGGG